MILTERIMFRRLSASVEFGGEVKEYLSSEERGEGDPLGKPT